MRDVDDVAGALVASGGEQPRVDQALKHDIDAAIVVIESGQLVAACASTRVLGPLTRRRQTQQQPPRDLLLLSSEVLVDRVGALRECATHTTGLAVSVERQRPGGAAFPDLKQRVLKQRQRPRLSTHVGEDRVDEAGLQAQPSDVGGLVDRLAQRLLTHRTDQQRCVAMSCARSGYAAQRS
ncbi:MAG: hypothetical protein LC790_07460 [Actinobacteria bacterium]|nr:hypothetical protein [Actinomycetota bacterium]